MHGLIVLLLACADTKTNDETEIDIVEDLDGDGFFSDQDCDDNDPTVNPNSDEICDGAYFVNAADLYNWGALWLR